MLATSVAVITVAIPCGCMSHLVIFFAPLNAPRVSFREQGVDIEERDSLENGDRERGKGDDDAREGKDDREHPVAHGDLMAGPPNRLEVVV